MSEQIKEGTAGTLPSLAELDNDELSPEQKAEQQAQAEEQAKFKAEQEQKEAAEKTEAEAKEAEEKAAAEAAKKAEEEEAGTDEDGITDAMQLFEEVNKRHGFDDLKVEYGDVDPGSPEGVYIREKVLIEKAQMDLESHIKTAYPRVYSYLLHIDKGGSDEEFFATPSVTLPEYEVFKNNVDLQKQVLSKDLRSKGLEEDVVSFYLEKAQKENKIFELADKAYKSREAATTAAVQKAEQESKQRLEAEQKQVKTMLDSIEDVVTNNKTAQIAIPDTKKAAFNAYLKEKLMFDGKDFFFIKTVDKDNISKLIEHEYFAFVDGNLKDLVKRRSDTERTKEFKLRLNKTEKQTSSEARNEGGNSFVRLEDI